MLHLVLRHSILRLESPSRLPSDTKPSEIPLVHRISVSDTKQDLVLPQVPTISPSDTMPKSQLARHRINSTSVTGSMEMVETSVSVNQQVSQTDSSSLVLVHSKVSVSSHEHRTDTSSPQMHHEMRDGQ